MTFLSFLLFISLLDKPKIFPSEERSSFILTFESEKPTRAHLFYGQEGPYEESLKGELVSKSHRFILRNLKPNTRYQLLIKGNNISSPVYQFLTPSEEKFRIYLAPQIDDSLFLKFLTLAPPNLLITRGELSTGISESGLLFPIRDLSLRGRLLLNCSLALTFGKEEVFSDSAVFSFLFLSQKEGGEVGLKDEILSSKFDLLFLVGGNSFFRTYPMVKNPYGPNRPPLISSGERFYYQKGEGTIFLALPDGRELSPLGGGNLYSALAQSGKGFVEILKENREVKVKVYLFEKEFGTYQPVDSFIIDKDGEKRNLTISGVRVKEVNAYTAKIQWATNLPSAPCLRWGVEPNNYTFLSPAIDICPTFQREHTFYLFGLSPNKRYYYQVGARIGQRVLWSEEKTFITLSPRQREVVLAVDFAHPESKSERNFLPVSPFPYPKGDTGANLIAVWDRDLAFSFFAEETLSPRTAGHWVKNSELATWTCPVPTGKYYYEIGSFAHPNFSGKGKIKIEERSLEKEGGDTIFFGEIEITDDQLNLQLGWGDSLVSGYSGISYLILTNQPKDRERTVFVLSATPNPFGDRTYLRYHLNDNRRVVAEVYDISGKKLLTLKNRFEPRGYQECVWDGRDLEGRLLPSGIYFLTISTEDEPSWKVKVSLWRE